MYAPFFKMYTEATIYSHTMSVNDERSEVNAQASLRWVGEDDGKWPAMWSNDEERSFIPFQCNIGSPSGREWKVTAAKQKWLNEQGNHLKQKSEIQIFALGDAHKPAWGFLLSAVQIEGTNGSVCQSYKACRLQAGGTKRKCLRLKWTEKRSGGVSKFKRGIPSMCK